MEGGSVLQHTACIQVITRRILFVQTCSLEKPNLDFKTALNFTKFLHTTMHSEIMQHIEIKRMSRHGIITEKSCISDSCVARGNRLTVKSSPHKV